MNNQIHLGYACINEALKAQGLSLQTMTIKYFNEQELLKRIRNNFYVTYKIMQWNVANNIHLYRYSSDLIPLATHSLNTIEWWKDQEVLKYCKLIRQLTKENNIQTSFHPSQYTLLTSPDDRIIQNSYNDLKYHYKLCKMLGCFVIIIHTGGVYNSKEKAIRRFKYVFNKLPQQIQELIYLENDDKSYTLEEVLEICEDIRRPIIPDYHHNNCLPSTEPFNHYLDRILDTWKYSHTDVEPKCHLSSSKEVDRVVRNHADYINVEDYENCVKDTEGKMKIMLECKKKELALLELRNGIKK